MEPSTPAARLRLSEFIQAIEEAKKANPKLGELSFRYYSLPTKEAIHLMLTGQGDEPSMEWRDSRPGDPRYYLKLFDEAGNTVPTDAESLQEGSNLYVTLEEVALHYLNVTPSGDFCTSVPWRSTTGDFILLGLETAERCKRAFIPYLKARQILKDRFDGVTDKEIALWLAYGNEGITAKASEYANARDVVFRHRLSIAEEMHFRKQMAPPTLADLLGSLYFSEEELLKATPQRWRCYGWLKDWAERNGVEEESLLAIIKPYFESIEGCFDSYDGRIIDPTPDNTKQGKDFKERAQQMMYRMDWILEVKESKFPDDKDALEQILLDQKKNKANTSEDDPEKIVKAVYSLLLGMAMDGYGFDPEAKKQDNGVMKKIIGSLERKGLGTLKNDTVLKHLREAVKQTGWNPDAEKKRDKG